MAGGIVLTGNESLVVKPEPSLNPMNVIKNRKQAKQETNQLKAQAMFRKFEMAEHERKKIRERANVSLGTGDSARREVRSIYSQLVEQRLKEMQDEVNDTKRSERNRMEAERKRIAHSRGITEAKKVDIMANLFELDLEHFSTADISNSVAVKSFKQLQHECANVIMCIWRAFESVQKEDQIPFWRQSLCDVEGEFGGGIASVFSLKRWLFCINLTAAVAWMTFVIFPYSMIDAVPPVDDGKQASPFRPGCLLRNYSGNPGVNIDSYWETPAVGDDVWIGQGSSDSDQDLFNRSFSTMGGDSLRWMYYSSYQAKHGSYRMDFAYVACVVGLAFMNMFGVIRNIAHAIQVKFMNQMTDSKRSYACSAHLFGSYSYSSITRKIVLINQKTIKNTLQTVLNRTRAANEAKNLGIKGQLRKGVGMLASLFLAFFMGSAIIWTLQMQAKGGFKELPIANAANLIITLIKVTIPKLIPYIVEFEKRHDVADVMQVRYQHSYNNHRTFCVVRL